MQMTPESAVVTGNTTAAISRFGRVTFIGRLKTTP
jgi:hypothetical protein